jgi:tetratricopeptide (TPR) repeat protein
MRLLCVCLLAVIALASPAFADSPSDSEIAQHYFEAGRAAFAQARYEEALSAFRTAAHLVPRAELYYDIGLCAERLGRREDAIAAYQSFLGAEHDGTAGADVEVRLRLLRGPTMPRRTQRLQTAAISLLAVTVALAAIGGGLIDSVEMDYNTLRSGCGMSGQCAPSSYRGIQQRDVTSKVLFGTAGVALAVDLGFWVAWARARRADARAQAAP